MSTGTQTTDSKMTIELDTSIEHFQQKKQELTVS